MTETIIITAGGKGLRMGTDIPKQFLPINGKPILLHTIAQFYEYNPAIEIILVLPESHIPYWELLIKEYQFIIPHQLVVGGETRYHSIKNGLDSARGELIGVHDGVRPFVSLKVISNVFEKAKEKGSAIPVLPIKESIRQLDNEKSLSVDRGLYKTVQTPQCFKSSILKEAYLGDYQPNFTDDASVVESAGYQISLVDGNEENIKITTPFDLELAKLLFNT
ncbi:MAG: 2-C-methyl-D-erythritol 4-phosphate cytidylyltransferase [Crocinitomicaceae bacterium]